MHNSVCSSLNSSPLNAVRAVNCLRLPAISRVNIKASCHHEIHKDERTPMPQAMECIYAITQDGSNPEAQVKSQDRPCRIYDGTGLHFSQNITLFRCWFSRLCGSRTVDWFDTAGPRSSSSSHCRVKKKFRFLQVNGNFSTRKQIACWFNEKPLPLRIWLFCSWCWKPSCR
jgi:hypothetical protein